MKRALAVALFLVGCSGGSGGTGGPSAGGASGLGGSPSLPIGTGGMDGAATGGTGQVGSAGAGGQPSANGAVAGGAGHGGTPGQSLGGSPGTAGRSAVATGGASANGGQGGTASSTGGQGGHAGAPANGGQGGTASSTGGQGGHAGAPANGGSSGVASPERGTVIAADSLNGHFLIQTPSGPQLFSDFGGCNFTSGTVVTFGQPTASCVSNTLTYSIGSCSVECDGAGYPGQITTATIGGEYSIATQYGAGMYRGETGACPVVFQGNQVIFSDNPAACALTYFVDTTTDEFCEVFCNM